MGFWPSCEGTPGSSELMYMATESWRNSHCSCNSKVCEYRCANGGGEFESDHELCGRSTFDETLLDQRVAEHDLSELDGEIILVRGAVLCYRRPNRHGRDGDVLPDVLLWPPVLWTKPKKLTVLIRRQ